jgi:DNA-binding response OmpR family regulator
MPPTPLNYGTIRLLLGEPNRNVREGLRSALFKRGFRDILDADSAFKLHGMLKDHEVDILVADTEFPDADVPGIIHMLRHGKVSADPFVPVILLSATPTPDQVKRLMDAGADDIMIKPVAPGSLIERIDKIIASRKPFVVTTDYLGPDRRTAPRPGTQQISSIDVPNAATARANGRYNAEEHKKQVASVAAIVNNQKIERHIYQIGYLVGLIVPMCKPSEVETGVAPHLHRLSVVSEDLVERLPASRYDCLSGICREFQEKSNKLKYAGKKIAPADIQALVSKAKEIGRTVTQLGGSPTAMPAIPAMAVAAA